MVDSTVFDVVIIGGGPVGLAAAYEVAKRGSKVIILEQNDFFNNAGSSGGLGRMFRTMYTEEFMVRLAKISMKHWDALEKHAEVSLRWMSGLLHFGDKNFGEKSPEGTLMGPVKNLDKFGMSYKKLTAADIEQQYSFKDLNPGWIGLFAPDNGVINVQLLLRTLHLLAIDHGAQAKQHTHVGQIRLSDKDDSIWEVHAISDGAPIIYPTKKIIVACGSFVNHILKPSFGISLDLETWEIVTAYFEANAGQDGTIFPSVWSQFGPMGDKQRHSFYGMPALPWGPPDIIQIAIGIVVQAIDDRIEKQEITSYPRNIEDIQQFIRDHIVGVDHTAPVSTVSYLQKNVFDNMFVLDFIPDQYLRGGPNKSIAIFTAGWAMKFIPTLGKALAQMISDGESKYALEEFSMTRKNPETGKRLIVEEGKEAILVKNVKNAISK